MSSRRIAVHTAHLAGASALALLMATPALADKWDPSIDAIGRADSDGGGGALDLFVPLYQDDDTLLFANALGGLDSDSQIGTALGLGLRLQIDESVILGGYVYGDWLRSAYDNSFFQVTGGLEAMAEDWDLRVTGYLPVTGEQTASYRAPVDGVDGQGQPGVGDGSLAVQGNELGIVWAGQPGTPGVDGFRRDEAALHGFEAEAGWKLPLDRALGHDWEVRSYLGGYYFAADDYDTFAGPRARIELRGYDLSFMGDGARVTLGAEASWDDPRGVTGAGLLRVRIPLGWFTGERKELSALDRRMVDPIPRRILPFTDTRGTVLEAEDGGVGADFFEAVEADETGNEITKVYFASGTGQGNGTAADTGTADDPTSLAAAAAAAGQGGLIVVLGGAGDVVGSTLLQTNQILIGGDTAIQVSGLTSGEAFTFDPGNFSAIASRPTIVSDAAANTRTLGTVQGSGGTWIEGVNLSLGAGLVDQRFGIHHQDTSNNLVRDVDIAGGLVGFYAESLNGSVANLEFDDVTTDGTLVGFLVEHADPSPGTIGHISLTDATFRNVASAAGGPVVQVNAGNDGRITDLTMTDVSVLNSLSTAFGFQNVDRVTLTNLRAESATNFTAGSFGVLIQKSPAQAALNSDIAIGGLTTIGYTTGLRISDADNVGVTNLAVNNAGSIGVNLQDDRNVSIDGATIFGVGTVAANGDLAVRVTRSTNVTLQDIAIDGMTHPAMGPGVQVTETGFSLQGVVMTGPIAINSAASTGNTTTHIATDCQVPVPAAVTGSITYDDLDDAAPATTCP